MNLSACKNAIIFFEKDDTIPLCEVPVSSIQDNIASLIIKDEFIDDLDAQMNITFLDENLGLVTYKCNLSAPKRYLSSKDGEWLNSIECTLIDVVSSLQRREDFKIKVDLNVSIVIPVEIEIPEDFTKHTTEFGHNVIKGKSVDISAGGIYFTCDFKFHSNLQTNIYLTLSTGHKLKIAVTVLRVDELIRKDGTVHYGYGCKYSKLPSGIESTIRNFVFQKQRENRRY